MAYGYRAVALASTLVLSTSISLSACGSDDSSDSGSGGNGATAGSGGSSASGGGSTSDAFAACGAKIVDAKTSAIDADEYALQATLWDRATIDCRLGPGYDHYHPDKKQDVRPTAPEVPLTPNPGVIYLCKDYQYGSPGSGTDFGSTSGQVAYASSDTSDLGIDRLQTAGWESGIECYNPQQGGYLGGPHPDPGVAQWVTAEGPLGLPRGMARTENVETGDGIVIFTTGHVGATGTQTSGGSYPIVKLPANKIPTAVALTTYNEFALVTVWDTEAIKGQVAVFALRAPSPGAFSINLYGAPNEAGFDRIQLLGFVDLPDMATPTAIAAGGNNGSYPSAWLSEGRTRIRVSAAFSPIPATRGSSPTMAFGCGLAIRPKTRRCSRPTAARSSHLSGKTRSPFWILPRCSRSSASSTSIPSPTRLTKRRSRLPPLPIPGRSISRRTPR